MMSYNASSAIAMEKLPSKEEKMELSTEVTSGYDSCHPIATSARSLVENKLSLGGGSEDWCRVPRGVEYVLLAVAIVTTLIIFSGPIVAHVVVNV